MRLWAKIDTQEVGRKQKQIAAKQKLYEAEKTVKPSIYKTSKLAFGKLAGALGSSRARKYGIGVAVLVGVLFCSWTAWNQYGLSPYSPTSGPYTVLSAEPIMLHDAARGRDLPLKIYYPDFPGHFPVIVFSHGALASKDCYSDLGRYWASYGYVVIHPSHADSIADSHFRGSLRDAISDPRNWESRPKDISFILDSLPQIERLVPELRGELDARHIGVGGHSFGAYTAGLIGGTTISIPGRNGPQSFVDKRASAFLLLSPQGENLMGLSAHSWDNFRRPMLLMYGSRDFGPYGEAAEWRSEPYRKAPAGNKYEVEIEGGTHMGFAGPIGSGLQLKCARLETLAFWDAYLKQDPKAKEYLVSHGLEKLSADAAIFARK
jgi:dienelactone hydrolase